MNLTRLAWANLRASPISSSLSVALLALGTATIVVLLLLSHQLGATLLRDAKGIDLVLGAKGSPVQLVLSAVYHADIPTGNIPLAEAQRLSDDRRVASAIPVSLGDSARGFRIVGTTHAYPAHYGAELAEGRLWEASLEAVLGAGVARGTGLGPGDTLTGAHGISGMGDQHAESPYRIVGVLAPTGTVVDRLILTGLESVWDIHGDGDHHGHAEDGAADEDHDPSHDESADHSGDEHDDHDSDEDHAADEDDHDAAPGHDETEAAAVHDEHAEHEDHDEADADHDSDEVGRHEEAGPTDDHGEDDDREITAMLVRYASPIAAVSLPRQINSQSNLQAAAPAFELTRLLQIVGLGLDGLRAFALILIASAAFSVFGAMYGALQSRRGELAMMRCLGATRGELMASLLIEGLLLGVSGAMLGLLLGHVMVEIVGSLYTADRGMALTGAMLLLDELVLALGLVLVALLAAALPAWQAYRTDVSRTLASHG